MAAPKLNKNYPLVEAKLFHKAENLWNDEENDLDMFGNHPDNGEHYVQEQSDSDSEQSQKEETSENEEILKSEKQGHIKYKSVNGHRWCGISAGRGRSNGHYTILHHSGSNFNEQLVGFRGG